MAFQSHRTRFQGDLAGIKQDKINELDYNKENLEDRISYVKEKYQEVEKYHEEYTSEYFKVNINTGDNISGDINVFKSVERDANYILNSLDVKRDGEYKYNLLTQEEFDYLLKKEEKEEITEESLLNVLKPKDKNEYVGMDLKVTNKDINEDSEMGEILRCYSKTKEHLKCEIKHIKAKEFSYLNVNKAKLILGTINCDMLDVKKSYKGITRPASKLGDTGAIRNFDKIDYTNPAHIKGILTTIRFGEIEPDSMLSHIAYDVEKGLKVVFAEGKIDSFDLEIAECINFGMSIRATASELQRDKKTIQQRLDKICRRIAEYYIKIKNTSL